jgi:hypothetical protein
MIPFTGNARRITNDDVSHAAGRLGCEVAALRAVMAVESRNSGYDDKRRPIILFEPHVFYRVLSPGKRLLAVKAGLAYQRWGEQPYPKTSDGNYDRLQEAIKIDEECAFRAVSIGLGQILGENFRAAGHGSAKAMFAAACESEGFQLDQMARFIEASGLAGHLRGKQWTAFALGYNGPGEKRNGYDALLARAYARWKQTEKPGDRVKSSFAGPLASRGDGALDRVKRIIKPVAIAFALFFAGAVALATAPVISAMIAGKGIEE